MNVLRRNSIIVLGLSVVMMCTVATVTVTGQNLGVRPTSVAVVDLGRVLSGLQQRGTAQVEMDALRDGIRTEKDQREAAINEKREQLSNLVGDAKAALEDEIRLEVFEFQAWAQFESDRIDLESALLLQDLYRSIKNAAKEMADNEGYDMVVVDDSAGELVVNPEVRVSREAQIRQQMISRRLLYVGTAVDVTEDLITRMNNAFQAGG